MNDKKLAHKLLYLLPLAAAVLTALPWCAKLRFMAEGEYFFEYFSGYSLIPVGYAVWSPMVAGICGLILAALGFAHARNGQPRLRWMMSISIVAVLMSVTPLAFGTMTIVGFLVFLAHGAEAVLLYRLRADQ